MSVCDKEQIRRWIQLLGAQAGEGKEFLDRLAEAIAASGELSEELAYYMEHEDFLCRAKVGDCTIIDIMVWQMDHFKAELDRDRYEMKHNRGRMLLRAFDTMLRMQKEPEKYTAMMQSETGTDYPGKY